MNNLKNIEKLQNSLNKYNIDVYYMNSTDYHMSEYVPEYFKTIRYFSGFTGSSSIDKSGVKSNESSTI